MRVLEGFFSHNESGLRLDIALTRLFPELTRSSIQRLIGEGKVTVDDKPERSNYKVRAGQTTVVTVPDAAPAHTQAEDIPLDIVYQDSDVLVIDKPQGMVVHPAAGNYTGTLVNALLHSVTDLSGVGGEQRPGIVHRLDKDTSGLLVVAKHDRAHVNLQRQLAVRTMTREYAAIVHGVVKLDAGTIDAPIARHPLRRKEMAIRREGRAAVTHYKVEERLMGFTMLSIKLETGRTHQIRVHMASIGHPVVGDPVYGPKKTPFVLPGQMLHARKLGFIHPTTGIVMQFESNLPGVFQNLWDNIRRKR